MVGMNLIHIIKIIPGDESLPEVMMTKFIDTKIHDLGDLLLIWINFDSSMDK